LQCSLSRRRMVFAATRRKRTRGLEGKMIGAAAAAFIAVRKGSPTAGAASIAGTEFASPWRSAAATSIFASLSRKPASTASASTSISVFLVARFLWTQSAASSADWSHNHSPSRVDRESDLSDHRERSGDPARIRTSRRRIHRRERRRSWSTAAKAADRQVAIRGLTESRPSRPLEDDRHRVRPVAGITVALVLTNRPTPKS